jgi:hypothetical protein
MKNDTTTTLLNFVLAVLVILGVVFALMTMSRTRELRQLTITAAATKNNIMQLNGLLNDVAIYNSKVNSPELTRAMALLQPKTITK